ncbi:hypothetical protein AWA2045_20990 [Lactiplantibacillus plantarum]|nr:hypothetical protein AWA2045_20990 [Lactiplantibacillus plantarum]
MTLKKLNILNMVISVGLFFLAIFLNRPDSSVFALITAIWCLFLILNE